MTGVLATDRKVTVLLRGSCTDGRHSLFSQLQDIEEYLAGEAGRFMSTPEFADMEWFQGAIHGILHDLIPPNGLLPLVPDRGNRYQKRPQVRDLHWPSIPRFSTARVSGDPAVISRASFCDTSLATVKTQDGIVSISWTAFFSAYRPGALAHLATSYRLCFVPNLCSNRTGFILRFCQHTSRRGHIVPPTLSTFRVQPTNGCFFEAVKSGDVHTVRHILCDPTNNVSPNDRDEGGNTPLSVSWRCFLVFPTRLFIQA